MIKNKKGKKCEHKCKPSQIEVDDALAALIASTKRKTRKLNPLQVAEKIQVARDGIGSLAQVAERIGLSYEMLRQIFSVQRCSEGVKKLVREGKLDSYDILYRLSKLSALEQLVVARAVIKEELNSGDVRAIVTFKKDFPEVGIKKVVERIKSSRNIKQYVAYFTVSTYRINVKILRSRFEKAFGKKNVISFEVSDGVGKLLLNAEGKILLQKLAKSNGVTKRKLIEKLVKDRAK